jgi:5'-methylthioadenosine phosphorylase
MSKTQPAADVAVIGGSGLSQIEGLTNVEQLEMETPFGRPSDAIMLGNLGDVRVAFLPRHGRGHRLLPSEIPFQANIFALKLLHVREVIAVSAVGSLQEDLQPMDMVIPDQLFDRTKGRPSTFFGRGVVAHVSLAHPFCPRVSHLLYGASARAVPRSHLGGTYVCMEGPAFSTLAESQTYKSLGFSVIGMTALPEAKLAREAGLCYAVLAQVTDYDCWHPSHAAVTSDMVMANVAANAERSKAILLESIPLLAGDDSGCSCRHALKGAIATSKEAIEPEALSRLAPLLDGVDQV